MEYMSESSHILPHFTPIYFLFLLLFSPKKKKFRLKFGDID